MSESSGADAIAVNGRVRHDSCAMTRTREPADARAARDVAGAPLPPPALVAIVMLVGWAIQWLSPLNLPATRTSVWLAAAATLAAMVLLVGAVRELRSARTEVSPWKPSTSLVTSGVFSISRNPVYLALLFVQVAFACWFGIGWWLVLLPASWLALDRIQVAREERYLATKFGEAYTDYQRRVRRWL